MEKTVTTHIDKCPECGCPQFYGQTLHVKTCPCYGGNRHHKRSLKEIIRERIANCKADIKYNMECIEEIRDCIKDVCLDEIYECRWDCMPARREAA